MTHFLLRSMTLMLCVLILGGASLDAQTAKKTRLTVAPNDTVQLPTDFQSYKVRGVCLSFKNLADSVAFVLVWNDGEKIVRTLIPLQDGQGNTTLWASGSGGLTKCYTMAFQFGDIIEAVRPDSANHALSRDTNDVIIQEYRPGFFGAVLPTDASIEHAIEHPPLISEAVLPERTRLPVLVSRT